MEQKINTKISISSLKKKFEDNKNPTPTSHDDTIVAHAAENVIITEESPVITTKKSVPKIKTPHISIQENSETSTQITENETQIENNTTDSDEVGAILDDLVKTSGIELSEVIDVKTNNEKESEETPLIEASVEKNEVTPEVIEEELPKTNKIGMRAMKEAGDEKKKIAKENKDAEEKLTENSNALVEEKTEEIFTNYTPYFDKRKADLIKKVDQIKKKVKTNWKFLLASVLIAASVGASLIFIDPSYHSFNNYKSSIIDAGHKIKTGENPFVLPEQVKINTIEIDTIDNSEYIPEPIIDNPPIDIIETPIDETIIPDDISQTGSSTELILKEKQELLKEVTKEILKDYFYNIKIQE